MKSEFQNLRLPASSSFANRALIIGIAGLALSAIGLFLDSKQFFYSYLTAYAFWVTLGLGGLFFTMLHHLVNATWSVVVRRIPEAVMITLPIMVIFFIPVALGIKNLYQWSDSSVVAADALLQKKASYLNTVFFLIRTLVYFAIWFLLARSLYRASLEQDKAHTENLLARIRRISAPGMILFALTSTFAAFDWYMSLDAHWYSTILGAYVFSGSVIAVLSFTILVAVYLRRQGILKNEITVEHYHDLGKLTFGFVIFWAYMAFSQYFLIWYANIPEETIWYAHRWEGSWRIVSLLIVFGHFALPFLLLISRGAKRNIKMLTIMTIWLLFIHWVDLHWIISPNLHHHGVHLSWLDLTTMIGIGGIFLWYFWRRLSSAALVPVNDPKLEASIHFINN